MSSKTTRYRKMGKQQLIKLAEAGHWTEGYQRLSPYETVILYINEPDFVFGYYSFGDIKRYFVVKPSNSIKHGPSIKVNYARFYLSEFDKVVF